MRCSHPIRILWVLFLFGAFVSLTARAEGELLLFPEIRLDHKHGDSREDTDLTPSVDIFGTARRGRFRLLGELTLTDEGVEAERLKLGYAFSPGAVVWAGRLHNPLGYWITQYHHGNYLQNSISRPEVARFDDNGGLFPNHVTGVLLDITHATGNRAFDYSLLAGVAPELRAGSSSVLHPVDLLDINSGTHKFSVTGRFAYRPDSAAGNQIGVFAGFAEMPVTNSRYDTVELTVAGLFASWRFDKLDLKGALYLVRDELDDSGVKDDGHFATGYVQADYPAYEVWIPFFRYEHSVGEDDDPYVGLMNAFVPRRQVLGLRWDFSRNQALKLEYSWNHASSKTFGETLLNWSAVFP